MDCDEAWSSWVKVSAMDESAMTSMISIAGLDKLVLFNRLYYSASDNNYDVDDKLIELATNGLGYVDKFEGIVFKVDFSATMVNTFHYNKHADNGEHLFERIVADMWARSSK